MTTKGPGMSFFRSTPYVRPALPLPVYPQTIPARKVLTEEDARPHCNVRQVKALLLGADLDKFRDCNGALDTFDWLLSQYIAEATGIVVKILRSPYDWCFVAQFIDGSGTNKITLPYKNIRDVTTVYIRVLPSSVWYHFAHPRRIDGTEQFAIGGQEPLPGPPERFPVNVAALAAQDVGPIYPTGVEDADLLVDTRRQTLIIPPRVLYAGLSIALWNYTWVPGDANIEVHYTFGFPPTSYVDGKPLQFDAATGIVKDPSPTNSDGSGGSPIDWSSGIPTGISLTVAKLVANHVRRQRWYGLTDGLSSLSVDGASESYGGSPYGGALDTEDEACMKALEKYSRQMVL